MNRLHIQRLTSIGAVEDGDNPESKIMFWKRREHEPAQGLVEKIGESMSELFDVDSLSDDAKAYVSDLEAKLAAALTEEEPVELPEDLPDIVTKTLDDQTAVIEKDQVEKAALLKRVTDLEDGIATEKSEARADELAPLFGDKDVLAPVLKQLDADSPEAYGKLNAMFDTLIVKDFMADMFKELGDSADGGTAADKVTAIAAEIRKNSPDTTPAEARAQAWRENPELMAQNREEGN
jgi:hypothetical protein